MRFSAMKMITLTLAAVAGLSSMLMADNATEVGGKFGLHGNVGYALYAMEELNGELAGPGITVDINSGLVLNGGVHYAVTDELLIGVDAGSLQASHAYEWEAFASYKNTYDLPATEFGAWIKYLMPLSDRLLVNLGAGAGLLNMSGTLDYQFNENEPLTTEISGSGLAFKLLAGSQFFIAPAIALNLDLGYRLAKLTEVSIDSTESLEAPDLVAVDYSGVFAQLGLALYF